MVNSGMKMFTKRKFVQCNQGNKCLYVLNNYINNYSHIISLHFIHVVGNSISDYFHPMVICHM